MAASFLDLSSIDFEPPIQPPISEESINDMIRQSPRRFRLSDFERPLKAPGEMSATQEDWNLRFPFRETFVPAFRTACEVDHIPFRSTGGPGVFSFLKPSNIDEIGEVEQWLENISPYVALRDCMALSFALDYDREGGNPSKPQTLAGRLRSAAKPYNAPPNEGTLRAANRLINECLVGVGALACYSPATCVVAMPPSRPNKLFDLPSYLADGITSKLKLPNLTRHVRTIKARKEMKKTAIESKLDNIKGTVEVETEIFTDQKVLLIEDLYQSGVSMNYVAMLLVEAGASKIFGLACEKTCRNDDNVTRRS